MPHESMLERMLAGVLNRMQSSEEQYSEGCQALDGTKTGWQDAARAFRFFTYAANRGHLQARVKIGECYEFGIGTDVDSTAAFRCYRIAADGKLAEGFSRLGDCYRKGVAVEKNFAEAVQQYHVAASSNDPAGQNGLGICYEEGLGVAINAGEAIRWYQLAAEHGSAEGQCNLGRFYRQGIGVTVDNVQAVHWFTQAAGQGRGALDHLLRKQPWPAIAEAMYQLGICYEGGLGVKQDDGDAARWYEEAASRHHAKACKRLAEILKADNDKSGDRPDHQMWADRAKEFAQR